MILVIRFLGPFRPVVLSPQMILRPLSTQPYVRQGYALRRVDVVHAAVNGRWSLAR